jgi:hypothetical protein
MRKLTVLFVVFFLAVSVIVAVAPAVAGFYCDLYNAAQMFKGTPYYYGLVIACISEAIMESETGRYW